MPSTSTSTSHLLTIENTTIDALEATPDVSVVEHFEFDGLDFECVAIDAPSDVAAILAEYAAVEAINPTSFIVHPQIAGPTPIDDPSEREPSVLAEKAATLADVRSLHNLPDTTQDDADATGGDVKAVVMDSGIDTTHEVFDGVSIRHVDATSEPVREFYDPPEPVDAVGHGSGVAGLYTQLAPDSDIISLRIFGARGTTDGRTVLRAYEWLHSNTTSYDIVNMSWGTSNPVSVIDRVHNELIARGVRTISSAGNSGRESGSPATASKAFSAGSCDKHGRISPFSSYNPGRDNPDVTAIGQDIRLPQARNTRMGRQLPGRYISANGTSFSSPLLAAMVSLYLERSPTTDPATIQHDFETTARDVEGERDGAGLADYGATVPETQNHESEATFEAWLVEQLEAEYGPENVHSQHRFSNGRRCDILVEAPHHDQAWELENDAGSAYNGSGQSDAYRVDRVGETDGERNVVAYYGVPTGHIEVPERRNLRYRGIVVREFDLPEDVSTQGV